MGMEPSNRYRKLIGITVLIIILTTIVPLSRVIAEVTTPFNLIKKWSGGNVIGGSSNAFSYPWFYTTLSNTVIAYNLETGVEKKLTLKAGQSMCTNSPTAQYLAGLAPGQIVARSGWVAIAPHYGVPVIASPDLSSSKNVSTTQAKFSYWLDTDGSTIFWLSDNGLTAFTPDGQVLWTSNAVSQGMFSISGSKLLVATGNSLVTISKTGTDVETFNIPALSTSPEGYVGLTNGTLMRYSSGILAKLLSVDGAIRAVRSNGEGKILLATDKGLFLTNSSKVLGKIDGDFRCLAYQGGIVVAGGSKGVVLTSIKEDNLTQPYWGPTKLSVNWVSLYESYCGVTYALSLTELYVVNIPDPESNRPHIKITGTWTKELSATITSNTTIPISIDSQPGKEPEAYIQSLTVTPTKIMATNLPTSLLRSPNCEPWYFNLITQKDLGPLGRPTLAYAEGFWNIQQNQISSGGLSLQTQFKMDAYWNPPPFGVTVSESVPTGVGAVYWTDTPMMDLERYETLKITAQIIKPGTTKMPSDMVFQDLVGTVSFALSLSFGTHTILKGGATRTVSTGAVKNVVDRLKWYFGSKLGSGFDEVSVETVNQAAEWLKDGKISIYGFSNYLADLLRKAEKLQRWDVTQAIWNAAKNAGAVDLLTHYLMQFEMQATGAAVAIVVGLGLACAKDIPIEGLKEGDYTLTRNDVNGIIGELGKAFGSTTDLPGAMAETIVTGLQNEGLVENNKVSYIDAMASVEYALEVAAYSYLKNVKNIPNDAAKKLAEKLRAYVTTAATSEVLAGQTPLGTTPSTISVNPTSFKTYLTKELVKLGLSESEAQGVVNAANVPDIVVVLSEPIKVSFQARSSWQGVVVDIIASLLTWGAAKGIVFVTGSTIAGAAVFAAGATLLGFTFVVNLINDVLLGPQRQGASVITGFAFIARYSDGSRKMVVMADVPDVTIEALKPWGLGDIKGWLEQCLDSYVKSMGLSGIVLRTDIPNGDLKYTLTNMGISVVEKIGIFMLAVAWHQLPYYSQPPITGSFEGFVTVQNLNVEGLRIKKSEPSAEELSHMLSSLKLSAAGTYLGPTVSAGSAVFTISSSAEFVPAPVVSLEFGEDWQGYFATFNITANCWIIQHFVNYSGNLIADMKYDGSGLLLMKEVGLIALPNKDPKKIGTMVWFPDGARNLDVPLNKFTMVPRTDGLRNYVTTAVEYFDPGNGKRLQYGEHRLYYVIYNETATLLNDTSVFVMLNGTTNMATLPSMATAYIDSPGAQKVELSLSYKIEIEEENKWTVIEEGVLLKQSIQFSSAGRKTVSSDISRQVAKLVDEVRERSKPGELVVRAEITPEIDSFPANNWDEATVPMSPELANRLLSPTQNATLSVRVVNITYVPIAGANVNITGTVSRSGVTNSTGQVTFENIPSGVYVACASATGYVSTCRSVLANGTTTLTLILAPSGYTKLPPESPYQGNSTQPPYQAPNGTIIVPLEVKATYKDGYPVAGANVFVNNTLQGTTDSWGTWIKYYTRGTQVTVRVEAGTWVSDSRTVTLNQGTLLTFVVPTESNVSLPEVGAQWVDVVYTRGRVPATYAIFFRLFSTIPQNITVKAGLMFDNRTVLVYSTKNITFSERGMVTDFVFVDLNQSFFTTLRPFVNITSYENDTNPNNNMLIGSPYKFSPQLELTIGIYVEAIWGNIKGILYPGDTKISAQVFIISGRDVNFVGELNSSIVLQVNKTTILPEARPETERKQVQVGSLGKGNTTLVTWNFTLPWARVINITASIPLLTELDMSGPGTEAYTLLQIPPHFIVISGTLENPSIKPKDTIKVKVKAWSNAYASELPEVTPYFTIEGVPVSGLSPLPFKAGTREYEVKTIVPEVTLPSWVPFKTANITLFMAAVPDVIPGDNFYKASILMYNPSSWVFWALVVIAALAVLAIIVGLVRMTKRAKQIIDEESEKRMKFVKRKRTGATILHKVQEEEERGKFVKRKKH